MKKLKLKLNFDEAFSIAQILFDQIICRQDRFRSNPDRILFALLTEVHSIFMKKCAWSYEGDRSYAFTMAQGMALREAVEANWLETENTWMQTILLINHNRLHKMSA